MATIAGDNIEGVTAGETPMVLLLGVTIVLRTWTAVTGTNDMIDTIPALEAVKKD